MGIPQIIVSFFLTYAALGVLFGMAFVWRGAGVIDHAAQASGLGFRLIAFPAAVALWPLLLLKWIKKSHPAAHTSMPALQRTIHLSVWVILTPAILALLIWALLRGGRS